MPPTEIETNGAREFEPAGAPWRRAHPGDGVLGLVLLTTSGATLGAAVWLFAVIATLLPARDPAHLPMWRWIALACLGYTGLSLAFLCSRRRVAVLRGSFLVASTAAVGAGLYGIDSMVRTADRGGHFEGYLVLMGWILCCHGVTAILLAWKSGRAALPAGSP
jgi:hypothetical protein